MDSKLNKKLLYKEFYDLDDYDSDEALSEELIKNSINNEEKDENIINKNSINKNILNDNKKKSSNKISINNGGGVGVNINNINNSSTTSNKECIITEKKNDNKSFDYKVHIDFNKRKYISENINDKNLIIQRNTISTSKYTYLNAIPKILFEQFSKIANIYFLIIAFFQVFKEISNSNGKPVILFPLFIVVSVNGIKDFYEDWKRKKSDDQENSKNTLIYDSNTQNFVIKQWKDILVGDIIKVKEDEYFPADCIILNTSEDSNCCYIETKSIDGETNLKFKKSNKNILEVAQNGKNKENLIAFDKSIIQCEPPNEFIYQFNGKFVPKNNDETFIDIDNFILRGCSLKQTSYVHAVVIYVGHDTKIMKNSVPAKEKVSKIENIMNHQIIIVFGVQFIIAGLSSLIGHFQLYNDRKKLGYIFPDKSSNSDYDNRENLNISLFNLIISTGTWIILINNIVPISLLMTLEMVKYLQGMFISWDFHMYDLVNHQMPKVQTSTLNEELGQVKFIFTDKTGTLTKNYMEYRAMSINGKIYGLKDTESSEDEDNNPKINKKDNYGIITNFNFLSKTFMEDYVNNANSEDDQYQKIDLFLLCLALCHSVITDQNALPNICYKSSSPDEAAMVNCARNFGVIFEDRDVYDNIFILKKNKNTGKDEKQVYKFLNCLDYSSERKRMAVIVRAPDNKIYLFAKGADSAIGERVTQNKELLDITGEHLIKFARKGLRTLMIAYRELSEEEYNNFDSAFKMAMNNPEKKDILLKDAYALVEKDYFLLGATAIEDKLQDNISDVLFSFIEAGIKIWVLTGDKMDTAKSIAYSCKLLDHSFILFEFEGINKNDDEQEVYTSIKKNLKKFFQIYFEHNDLKKNSKFGLIVSLNELNIILGNEELENLFYSLSIKCNTVLCCRVSPKQKAQMVNLVKERQPNVTTLAIGDGANDVNMITTASIGIGIMGVEGLQAARASDYCISEFQFLKRLLFVHGRESYRKNSFIVCYNFYKNFLFVLPQFWLGFVNYFSGQYLYDPWIYQLFNIIFACFPIVWFGIYDKEVSYDILISDSRYYTQGIINKLFHNKRFWKWVLYGIIQAFFVYIYSFHTCNFIYDGYLHDITSQGSIAYSGIVLIVNIKILTTTNSHTFISLGLFLFSVLSYYFILWLMSLFQSFYNFNNFKMVFYSWEFYLSTLLLLVLCTVLDKGIDKFCRIFGIILDPLRIDVNKFEPKENKKEMSIIKSQLDEINNDFTGAAFTYSQNNDLKTVLDIKRESMNK